MYYFKRSFKMTYINNLFQGSGQFTDAEKNEEDVLIVDEAHRLNAKSGMFQNLGENQIKDIINASNFSVFFIDEDQKVTLKDIGSVNEIGCIHTCQGLEFDYVGVIIGDDIRYENGHIVTDYKKRTATDQSLKGINKIARED